MIFPYNHLKHFNTHITSGSQICLNPLIHFKLSASKKTSEYMEPQHDRLIDSKTPTRNDK